MAYGISAGRLAGPVCRLLRQVPKLLGFTVSRCEQIMPEMHRLAGVGFHAGELAVQRRAGVEAQAARLAPMLEPVELDGGIAAGYRGPALGPALFAQRGERRDLPDELRPQLPGQVMPHAGEPHEAGARDGSGDRHATARRDQRVVQPVND